MVPLNALLEDLEQRIDESVEAALLDQWRIFCELRLADGLFAPARPHKSPPAAAWPKLRINAALEDFDLMAMRELASCSAALEGASGRPLMVRANYGSPIMAILLGAELFVMPDETDTLPTCRPYINTIEALAAFVGRGEPSLEHPYLQRVFEMGRRFRSLLAPYPKVARWVRIYHPDLQGPMDILEMLCGSDLFMLLVDEPALVHRALDLIARTYIRVMRAWEQIAPLTADSLAPHWGLMHKGAIMLRDDSAMNLSPEMFEEFMLPYDQRLLDEFGGGAMHACGRVDHFIDFLPKLRGLHAFNMGQPPMNAVACTWPATVDAGIVLLDFSREIAERAGRPLRGRVQVG